MAAVFLALLIFHWADVQTRLFAGMGAAFLMQCSSTGPRKRQMLTMIITGISMMVAVGLGSGLEAHKLAQDVLLAVVTFTVFYVRRFLPDQNMFPLFGFILFVLSTALPGGWARARMEMVAMAAGIPVTVAIYFFIYPHWPAVGFRDSLQLFLGKASFFMRALSDMLQVDRSEDTGVQLGELLIVMQEKMRFDQDLVDNFAPREAMARSRNTYYVLLVHQYEAYQAQRMLHEAMSQLLAARAGDNWRRHLKKLLLHLSEAFVALEEITAGAVSSRMAQPAALAAAEQEQLKTAIMEAGELFHPEIVHLFSVSIAARHLAKTQAQLEDGLLHLNRGVRA